MEKEKKFSFLADEYDTGTLLNSDALEIGRSESWGTPDQAQQQKSSDIEQEEVANKLRKENEKLLNEGQPEEKREMVMHGATLQCPYAQGEGKLEVTSNELKLQDVLWATEGDGNNMVNLKFPGICNHPKWGDKKPPCLSVINLSPWQNVGTTIVQEQRVLVKESCINCNPTPNSAVASPIPLVDSINSNIGNNKCFCNRDLTSSELKDLVIRLRKGEVYIKNGRLVRDEKGKPILKNGKKQFRDITQYDMLEDKLFHLALDEKINISEANFETFAKELNAAMKAFEITTCIRKIHFIAQCYHETQRFSLTYEKNNNYMKNYKGGPSFRGRGLIQVTHDYGYTAYYNFLNKTSYKVTDTKFYKDILLPFTKKLSTELKYACKSAGWNWKYDGVPSVGKDINLLADKDDVLLVSRAINGNVKVPNGLEERKKFTKILKDVMKYNECINKK